MSGALGALQFLTRVPVHVRTAPDLTRSVPWFPVVGAVIGIIVGAVAVAASELVPMPVAATIAVLTGVLITGAFHEDGLADVADAFAGGWDREQRFRILTDPLHGSYGVAALSGSILLRVVCVTSLGPAAAFGGLVAAHSLARGGSVAAMAAFPTARPTGLGADYARGLRPGPAILGALAAIAIAALAIGWWTAPVLAAVAIAVGTVGWLAMRKLGGITGDVLGAIEQVGECLVLVVLTGIAARHTVWWA